MCFIQLIDFLVFINCKNLKNMKRNTQNKSNEAKSCLEELSKKKTRLEHVRQNMLRLLTNPVNLNCPEFVTLNKKAAFEKLDGNVFDKLKDFGKQGFLFFAKNYLKL